MTGLSADRFGLRGRGQIGEGYYADPCIFDPQIVLDRATYEQPAQPTAGIHHVFVNGALALEHGIAAAARAGQILTRGASLQ